ncbi:hypothetical protein VNI00_019189 [Paramarasmius palmivorus]|uniref:Uncharacterized protein n=1 Tax=Paramarasmius palmivorus TaxID=297713 RepID=A0AAW0ARQ9_9AGAR
MENEATFVAPEGVYTVVEEHKPSVLQAHAASSAPIHYPTRLTTITVRFPAHKHGGGGPGFANLLGGNKDSKKEKEKPVREDGVSLSSSDTPDEGDNPSDPGNPPVNHHLFSSYSVRAKKKATSSRPKQNIKTTSSTFITRIQYAEGYAKLMQSKQGETSFIFYNQVKTLLWVEAGVKAKEPLARITFSAHPTCHDVNPLTASSDRLDVIVGFSTGDLIWLDPVSSTLRPSKPTRLYNKFPLHSDGTIVVYDREREDGTFTPSEPGPSHTNTSSANGSDSHTSSEDSWDPMDNIFVTMPPWHPVGAGAKSDKDKAASLRNPVSHWRVSKKSVVDFVFSPDVKYVGAISEDGCLRIIDALAEQ